MDIRRVLGAFCFVMGAPARCACAGGNTDATCEAAYASLPPGTRSSTCLTLQAATGARCGGTGRLPATRCGNAPHRPEFGYTSASCIATAYTCRATWSQDIAKACTLILPVAEAGYPPAYADLAEMEMRHAQAREAMKWTQVYLHFVDEVLLEGARWRCAPVPTRPPYNGNPLNRVELIWRHTCLDAAAQGG